MQKANSISDPTLQFSPGASSDKSCKGNKCPPSLQVVERDGPTVTIPRESLRTSTALCQSGEVAISGGYTADVPIIVEESKALPDHTGWSITALKGFGIDVPLTVTAHAECATLVVP